MTAALSGLSKGEMEPLTHITSLPFAAGAQSHHLLYAEVCADPCGNEGISSATPSPPAGAVGRQAPCQSSEITGE